jgi:hypothetical protein
MFVQQPGLRTKAEVLVTDRVAFPRLGLTIAHVSKNFQW